jgi:DnaJ-class molecular chaperone
MKPCPDCEGSGVIEQGTEDEEQCPTCGGTGFVSDSDNGDGREGVLNTSGNGALR